MTRIITNTSKYQHTTITFKKLLWLPINLNQRIDYKICLLTKHLQIYNLHLFTIVVHFRHVLFLQSILILLFFPFHMSDHHLAVRLSLSSVHDSGIHSLRIPKLVLSTNIPFQAQNTPLQNCVPFQCSFSSHLTVYPDFDSCYSLFMPYRITPSIRHRAIEIHYYYYYYHYNY